MIVGSLALRLVGIGWGLPNELRHWSLHPDEPIVLGYSTMVEPAKLDFDPDFYNYGTLPLTLNRMASLVVGAYGGEIKDPYQAMRRDHLAGRWLSLLSGVGMVAAAGLFLWRRMGRVGALLGAAAVAVSPGLVVHSRFQTVDVMAALWVTLALIWAAKAVEAEGAMKPALFCGLFAGLAASTKYSGVVVLAALLPVLWVSTKRADGVKAFAWAVGVALLAFFLTTPGALLHTDRFMRDFQYEMWHTSTGHGLVFAATAPGAVYHLANLFLGFGVFVSILGLVGLVWGCRKPDPQQAWIIGFALFALIYYVLIARAEVKFLRYCFPLIPVLAVGLAWLMREAHVRSKTKTAWKLPVALGFAGIAGIGGGGLADSVQLTVVMAGEDVRDQVARELKGAQSVGLVSDPWFYTASFYPEVGAPRGASFEQREQARLAAVPPVLRYVPEDPSQRLDFDVRLLKENPPEYVIFSSFETEGLDRLAAAATVPEAFQGQVSRYKEFMAALQKDYGLMQVYGANGPEAHDLMYVQPRIWVWKRSTNP